MPLDLITNINWPNLDLSKDITRECRMFDFLLQYVGLGLHSFLS